MTEQEKSEAIDARINGEWDNPHLKKIGDLGCIDDDIERIIQYEE